VTGAKHHTRGRAGRFVSRPADLEIDSILPLQQDFAIVESTRHLHDAERTFQRIAVEVRRTERRLA
jgi:hypothetical protein